MTNHHDNEPFTVLENKKIGRNIALYRRLMDKKALEVAEHIGISEHAYSKYERGEVRINVDFVQKVAEFLQVDPLRLLSETPVTYMENNGNTGNDSPNSSNSANGDINYIGADKELMGAMVKLIENVTVLTQKVVDMLDKEK